VKTPNISSDFDLDFEFIKGHHHIDTIPQQTPASSNDIRMIVFTSGSTGEPKGVCLSESNILSAARMMATFLSLNPRNKSLVTVPLYDYYGFIQIYGHLYGKSGFIFGEHIGFPTKIIDTINNEKITDLVLVPYTLRELLKIATARNINLFQSLDRITSSSDLISADTINNVFNFNSKLKLFNIYGLTEAGRACYKIFDKPTKTSNIIGNPSMGVDIFLDQIHYGQGEIVIRGPNVMLGYLKRIASNNIHFTPCSEVFTGDLGYYNEKGEIVLIGRRDHLININGQKIHPSEIENIAMELPFVLDAYAHTTTDDSGDICVSIDVITQKDKDSAFSIKNYLRQHLQPVFHPKFVNFVDVINRTELGSKILRHKEP
jgi:acyl-CoA synthetase (AMP-forming)/AMP-acid ligase II